MTAAGLDCCYNNAKIFFSPQSTVSRHRNLRLAYIAQEHTFHLKEFWNCAPLIYMQKRYQHGWDSELQHRLKAFSPEEEEKITEQAKKFGKYGRRVKDFCGRQIRGKEVFYEVQWEGLDDAKQNTFEPSSKLRQMGIERLVRAYDERAQSVAAGNDQRPLTNREIIRHFGRDFFHRFLFWRGRSGGRRLGRPIVRKAFMSGHLRAVLYS